MSKGDTLITKKEVEEAWEFARDRNYSPVVAVNKILPVGFAVILTKEGVRVIVEVETGVSTPIGIFGRGSYAERLLADTLVYLQEKGYL